MIFILSANYYSKLVKIPHSELPKNSRCVCVTNILSRVDVIMQSNANGYKRTKQLRVIIIIIITENIHCNGRIVYLTELFKTNGFVKLTILLNYTLLLPLA